MKRKSRKIVLFIVLMLMIVPLSSCNNTNSNNRTISSMKTDAARDGKWLADIEFVEKELPQRHKNLFFKLKEQDFHNNIEDIIERVPELTDDEVIIEMSKLIASVGDGHTRFSFNSEEIYPFGFYYFNDGVYLVDTVPEHSEFIGYRLKGINDTNIKDLMQLVKPIISHENEPQFKNLFTKYIIFPEVLNGLKISSSSSSEFIFIDKDGNERSVKAETYKNNDIEPVGRNIEDDVEMLYLKNPNKNYWYEYIEDENILYFQYSSCTNMKELSFKDFNTELFNFIDNNSIDKLVIDLRNNGGGNSSVMSPFFRELRKRKALNDPKKLFVIIGRKTFSSAILNALEFKNNTNATFVGEPTGGKPNHYGEVKILDLTNTNTRVTYSSKYFEHSSEDLNTMIPDFLVEPKAEDYFKNIDRVLLRIMEIE
ncbi:S41 family peptidase [Alkaliphilus hydrothermalis]|uniref:Tail specific protease domain-containing protein n=1 Tax=Alkaliphilus hydrothermalis TaxID=1482730 RepID=A0ABS2NMG7_9FIRM|nr:S41 family peptidase [Alkaliphilus hydrothermalis]MBM7614129.1 hypothetical protein [Alkaliphilus hydrothermalis]